MLLALELLLVLLKLNLDLELRLALMLSKEGIQPMPMPIPLLAASSGTASSPRRAFPGAGSSGNASLAYAPTTLAYDATGSAAAQPIYRAPAALGASPASLSVPDELCYWYWIFICTRCWLARCY